MKNIWQITWHYELELKEQSDFNQMKKKEEITEQLKP